MAARVASESGLPSFKAEHRTPRVRLPSWQRTWSTTGHGGHGPGWHPREHGWAHPLGLRRAHGLPHECGVAGGRGCGSVKRPQKHVYLLGTCAAVKSSLQLGQDQCPARVAGSGGLDRASEREARRWARSEDEATAEEAHLLAHVRCRGWWHDEQFQMRAEREISPMQIVHSASPDESSVMRRSTSVWLTGAGLRGVEVPEVEAEVEVVADDEEPGTKGAAAACRLAKSALPVESAAPNWARRELVSPEGNESGRGRR